MHTEIALFVTFAALACLGFWVFRRQQRVIREIQRQKVRIQTEERRIFDFLHNLGEALSHEARPGDLHGSIVDGAMRVMEANGGALYLSDKTGTKLRPAVISRDCPPFVDLPSPPGAAATSLQNQLLLHAVRIGEGLVGGTFAQDDIVFPAPDDPGFAAARAQGAGSAFLAPLVHAGQRLGVLAVSRDGDAEAFGAQHYLTINALVELSAFSLWDAILHHEAAEKKQFVKDLQIATEVQRILLPDAPPRLDGFEVAGINVPARYLSGDYFDYIPLDEHRCGVAIADVSGKGVPAALLMAMCRSVLRLLASGGGSPAEVMKQLNAQLFPDIKEDMFISMAYAILDNRDGTVLLTRSGHDAPLVFRAGTGVIETIKPPGMAVGIDSGGAFNRVTVDFSLPLNAGDCLVFYTDGVTEALDAAGGEFGMEAMKRAIQASAPEGADAVVRKVADDVSAFIGDHPQHDDITLIAIKKK